jgi:hypothetical protein
MSTHVTKTRGGVLSDSLKAQLHLDIESYPSLTWDQVLNLPGREYKKYTVAVHNCFNYLKLLKTMNPDQYWQLYSSLSTGIGSPGSYWEVESEDLTLDEDKELEKLARKTRSKGHRKGFVSPAASWSSPSKVSSMAKLVSSSSKKKSKMTSKNTETTSVAPSVAFVGMQDAKFLSLEEAENAGAYSVFGLLCNFGMYISFPFQLMMFTTLILHVWSQMVLCSGLSLWQVSLVMMESLCTTS